MARRPLVKRAQLEARVRFGPEVRALSELLADARGNYSQGVKAEEGAAGGLRAALKAARPEMRKTYGAAAQTAEVASQDVARSTAGLGSAADSLKAVIAREQGNSGKRLGEARANALDELSQRGVDAEAGRGYAISNLRNQLTEDVTKIGRQRDQLAGEIGAFTHATYGDLKDARAQVKLENAKLDLSLAAERRQIRKDESDITGIDPETGKPTAAERERRRKARKGGKGGPSAGAVTKHQGVMGDIQDAKATVGRLQKAGSEYPSIGEVMTLPKSKDNPYGGYGPLVTRAAVELERDGKISQPTLKQLRGRGLLPGRVPKEWKRESREVAIGPGGIPMPDIRRVT